MEAKTRNGLSNRGSTLIRDFLVYHETIQGHSRQTVDEYYLDLRSFARYLKQVRDPSLRSVPLDHIPLDDVSLELFQSVTLTDVYSYMNFLTRDKGFEPASRAAKSPPSVPFINTSPTRPSC